MTGFRLARVKVAGRENPVLVAVTSEEKPPVSEATVGRWRTIVDLLARIAQVRAGLIMRLGTESIEVFLRSGQKDNPYKEKEQAALLTGLYCETVAGIHSPLLVSDAREEASWKDNPDIELGMVSYLGLPIAWPDGEIFGTLCVLDDKKNSYGTLFMELMGQFQSVLEGDLKGLLQLDGLIKLNMQKEWMIREIHHRIKNNFALLVSLLHLKPDEPGDTAFFVKEFESRIMTISLIHEKIYKSDRLDSVSLKDYVTDLIRAVLLILDPHSVELAMDIDDAAMAMESLIPLGMLLHELVTNSIRHAFKDHPGPVIRLELKKQEDGRWMLEYRDNGKGYPAGFDLDLSATLGMRLIRSLTAQMNGRDSLKPGPESVFTIEFPPNWERPSAP